MLLWGALTALFAQQHTGGAGAGSSLPSGWRASGGTLVIPSNNFGCGSTPNIVSGTSASVWTAALTFFTNGNGGVSICGTNLVGEVMRVSTIGAFTNANGIFVIYDGITFSTPGVPVKAESAVAGHVVNTTTSDTGAGVVLGVCGNLVSASSTCMMITSGQVAMFLGTGTCAIGQFVIVDTTTDGYAKCTSSYTAGTVIGVAMQAQSVVGSQFNVMVGLR